MTMKSLPSEPLRCRDGPGTLNCSIRKKARGQPPRIAAVATDDPSQAQAVVTSP
jgi:hypothetical protein